MAKSFGDRTVFEELLIFKSLTVILPRKEFLQEFLQDPFSTENDDAEENENYCSSLDRLG